MTYHGFDFPDLPLGAFEHVGDRRIKPHGFFRSLKRVFRDITDPILVPAFDIIDGGVNLIGGAVEAVGSTVGKALENTIDSVVRDPIGSAVMIATAVYAPQLLPYVSAAKTAVQGGDLEDIAKSAAISYAAGQAGAGAAEASGSGLAGSAASGFTSAALRGQDPITGALASAINYGVNTGLNQAINAPSYSDGLPSDYISSETATPVSFEGQTYTEALPTDYSLKADYSFAPQQFTGLQAGDVQIPTDLELDTYAPPISNLGLQFNEAPNLKTMGGGQGLVADVPGGAVSSAGFIPSDASPNLGDPNSFINNPDVLGQPVAPVETTSNIPLPKLNVAGALLGPDTTIPEGGLPTAATTSPTARVSDTTGGALPIALTPSMLQAAPVTGEQSMPQSQDLPQLFPNIANVDPRLLQVLASRNMQRPGYYNYGQPVNATSPLMGATLSGMPGPGIPVRSTSNAYSPLSSDVASGRNLLSAGLNALGGYAAGGNVDGHNPQFITGKTGYYVRGEGDGQSDSIPAMLADGEYVFDADTVAALGNGSNEAGARVLDKMRENIRKHKRSAKHGEIPPPAKSPLAYMKG